MSETFQETWHRLKELDGESHSCTDIMFCTCRNSKDAKLDGQVQTAITKHYPQVISSSNIYFE